MARGIELPVRRWPLVTSKGDRPSHIRVDPKSLSKQLAVHELEGVLSTLGARALNGRYVAKQPISRRWTADFYIPEIKLAIDVENSKSKQQVLRRIHRRLDCRRFGITLLRLTEAECWGDRDKPANKLREAWRTAHQRPKRRASSNAPALAVCALLGVVSAMWFYPEWFAFFPQSTKGCSIKGNISENGKIYHLPGQWYYDRTVINRAAGERWFCSEEEARAAGWRRARR